MVEQKAKKILVTGGNGMLAYDFYKYQKEHFDIILVDKNECDVSSFESILQCIAHYEPDVILNAAAYTAVDDAEDIGSKMNYDINALGMYFVAKAASVFGIECILISTDYVFDGKKSIGYMPDDIPNPVNAYGMAKYLGERLALDVNPSVKIIRTSWLYGGETISENAEKYPDRENGVYKNFVNTMLRLSKKNTELRVVDDQHGRPTDCRDLSEYIAKMILEENDAGGIFHFSSPRTEFSLTWADFAEEIFAKYGKSTRVVRVPSSEYPTKARRPEWSILI